MLNILGILTVNFQKIPRNIKVPLLLHYLPRQTH